MAEYVGLDVSLKETNVCILDGVGQVVFEGRAASNPAAIAALISAKTMQAGRVGLESGQLSVWLCHELRALGFPVVCLDARQAHATLSVRPTKTDRSDARGLAEIVRMGWYREVQVKSLASHERRALLSARDQLIVIRRQLESQIRGLLKVFGIVLSRGVGGSFTRRVKQLAAQHPMITEIVSALMDVHGRVCEQIKALDRRVHAMLRGDATARRLMTVPGVGPITALAYLSTIDDPKRFRRSEDVGAYLGLTPRRYQSGEVDRRGRISKHSDRFTRTLLYEAATVLLTRVKR